ncbi:hypothetical protein FWH58_01290 [Candidatus Saccharibacteria bacterium]|nr:hypothetical protein [Candidatus Saccharibacteria bacterium]
MGYTNNKIGFRVKKIRNVVVAVLMTMLLVVGSPAQMAWAEELTETETEIEAVAVEVDTDASQEDEESVEEDQTDADLMTTFEIASLSGILGVNQYDPANHHSHLVGGESSSDHWDSKPKITELNNDGAHMSVVIYDQDGNELSAVIYRRGHGQNHGYDIYLVGETEPIITIDYDTNSGNTLTVIVTEDVTFTVRWETNHGTYEYYTINEAGEYEIPRMKVGAGETLDDDIVINDMWLDFGEPQLPPPPDNDFVYVCQALAVERTTMRDVKFTITPLTTDDDATVIEYKMDFGDGFDLVATDNIFEYQYASAGDFTATAYVTFAVDDQLVAVAVTSDDCSQIVAVTTEDEPGRGDLTIITTPSTGFYQVSESTNSGYNYDALLALVLGSVIIGTQIIWVSRKTFERETL